MNNSEKLSNLAVKEATLITHWLNTAAHTGSHFVAVQTPLVVHEIIAWGVVNHTMGLVLGLLSAIICSGFIYKGINILRHDSNDVGGVALTVSTSIGLGISIIVVVVNASDLAYIIVAPRLYIIEQLRHMLR